MFAATATILTALLLPGQARETRPPDTDQTVPVSKGARLAISNFAGEVVIRTWDRDQLRVQARHTSKAKVSIRPTPSVVAISSNGITSVDYEITAPAWMPMKIEGTYNFVTVEGAQSEVSAETVRGDVVIKGGNGVVARSIQGEVSVEGARGRIIVSSVNEGIRVTGSAGDIKAETTNGDISLAKITSSSVEVATVNGQIAFDGSIATKGRYLFATHNGNITVGIPEDSNVSFSVRTYNGSFSSSLNLSGPPRSEARRGRRVTYTLGNGSAEMEMETFGGSIRIGRPGSASSTTREKEKDKEHEK